MLRTNMIFDLSVVFFLATQLTQGQTPVGLQFEVASVRAAGPLMGPGIASLVPKGTPIPAAGWMAGGPGTPDPERIAYTRVLMMSILTQAFVGLDRDQFSGPSWLFEPDNPETTERYDIAAKVPPGTTKEQASIMMQNLLKARFGLAFHYEKRDFDVYALVVAKNGPKLKVASEGSAPAPVDDIGGIKSLPTLDSDGFPQLPPGRAGFSGRGQDGRMRTTARMQTATDIAKWAGFLLRNNHIVDKTGLTGKYDFKIEYTNGGLRATSPADGPSDPIDDFPTALERQVGLRLEKSKAPLDVLVIDHINKIPTEN
jgi:uncharacterized protein (TIGR03435 family)